MQPAAQHIIDKFDRGAGLENDPQLLFLQIRPGILGSLPGCFVGLLGGILEIEPFQHRHQLGMDIGGIAKPEWALLNTGLIAREVPGPRRMGHRLLNFPDKNSARFRYGK